MGVRTEAGGGADGWLKRQRVKSIAGYSEVLPGEKRLEEQVTEEHADQQCMSKP